MFGKKHKYVACDNNKENANCTKIVLDGSPHEANLKADTVCRHVMLNACASERTKERIERTTAFGSELPGTCCSDDMITTIMFYTVFRLNSFEESLHKYHCAMLSVQGYQK